MKSSHHLTPKARGGAGKGTIYLHKVCHDKIHSVFTNKELEKTFNTIDAMKTVQEIQDFVGWIKNKPIDFYVSSKVNRKNLTIVKKNNTLLRKHG
jgi:predicted DNA-binding protein (UPF0278 family)